MKIHLNYQLLKKQVVGGDEVPFQLSDKHLFKGFGN
jgi:hypothetical protein